MVENHEDTLRALTMYLVQMGHAVIPIRTMGEAFQVIPQAEADVLISDIGLPDGDGWDLLERVQLPRPVFAIAMSGFGLNADRLKSKAAGYRRHLLKPFVPDDLDALLSEAALERGSTA